MSTQAMARKKDELVSELKTLPPCTRDDCKEHKIPTSLIVADSSINESTSDEINHKVKKKKTKTANQTPVHFSPSSNQKEPSQLLQDELFPTSTFTKPHLSLRLNENQAVSPHQGHYGVEARPAKHMASDSL
ncbi:hypothetical protein TNCV_3854321 [Trichonephila clavipes]|nr:hypothetical protein TNCV_3854321 [Trichonephila clavipes]